MKEALRKEYKNKRKNVLYKELKEDLIFEHIINSDLYKKASLILCYSSLKTEINTVKIINKALADKKLVALPSSNKNGIMDFYYIKDLSSLHQGLFGILEPQINKTNLVQDFKNSICIVPGLTFDERGYRLGYGKGYYDRFLSTYKGISIGLCYKDFLKPTIPINEFDQKVQYLCTDEKLMSTAK